MPCHVTPLVPKNPFGAVNSYYFYQIQFSDNRAKNGSKPLEQHIIK